VYPAERGPISLITGRRRGAGQQKTGIKTMTMKTNAVAGFASLILAVLPLVVIAGSLASSI
jgi:hypothetical protein